MKKVKNIVNNMSREMLEELVLDIYDITCVNSNNISNYRIANIVKKSITEKFMEILNIMYPDGTEIEFIGGDFKGIKGVVGDVKIWSEDLDAFVKVTNKLYIKAEGESKYIDEFGISTFMFSFSNVPQLLEYVKFIIQEKIE